MSRHTATTFENNRNNLSPVWWWMIFLSLLQKSRWFVAASFLASNNYNQYATSNKSIRKSSQRIWTFNGFQNTSTVLRAGDKTKSSYSTNRVKSRRMTTGATAQRKQTSQELIKRPSPTLSPSKVHPPSSMDQSVSIASRSGQPMMQSPEYQLQYVQPLSKLQSSPDLATQLDYARNGHCVLRKQLDSFFLTQLRSQLLAHGKSRELLAWQQKVEVASQSKPLAQQCKNIRECRQTLDRLGIPSYIPFLQYFHPSRSVPDVYRVVHALAETAAILMDVDRVRLYQDALFWKRPGDGPTPWHVDAKMAPFDTSNFITFWIPLQPIPVDGTALLFCSKSQSDFALPYWNPYQETSSSTTPGKSPSPWEQLEQRYGHPYPLSPSLSPPSPPGYRRGTQTPRNDPQDPLARHYMPLGLGDITAHSGWTLHCADAPTTEQRLALTVSYVDGRAPIRRDAVGRRNNNHARQSDRGDSEDMWSYQEWLPQVPTNTFEWDHPLVPIVWPRTKKPGRTAD